MITASLGRKGGGVSEAVRHLSQALNRDGLVNVSVLGVKNRDAQSDAEKWLPLHPQSFSSYGIQSFGYAPRMGSALGRLSPDIVHLHGLWMYQSVLSRRWGKNTGRPYVVSPHGMLSEWAVRNSSFKKRVAGRLFENGNLSGASCLHALNESEADDFRRYGLRNPIAIIGNGVALPDRGDLVNTPAWYTSVDPQSKICLFLGRIHPKKGLSNLLEAWARHRVLKAGEPWCLVIAGWNQVGHEEQLVRRARELGIESSVKFIGPQFDEDKAATLAVADAMILPSHSEGLPVVVLEAWAYGLPVLMTEACNLSAGFEAGAAVELPPDPGGMARVLQAFFDLGDAERRKMGERGRALVRRMYTWEKVANEMTEVYQWLLGLRSRPSCIRMG